jgi:hypothetical protein
LHDVTDLLFATKVTVADSGSIFVASSLPSPIVLTSAFTSRLDSNEPFRKPAGSGAVAAFPHDSAEFHDNAATSEQPIR